MLKIGLTGGIGSGKSTAANFFQSKGIDVIDLDQIAREVVEPGSKALNQIHSRFGNTVLTSEGELNRQALSKVIFSNQQEKAWLESLLHPLINSEKQQKIESSKSAYIVIEIPLLVENQLQKDVDRVLLIDCDEQQQLSRAKSRGNQTEDQIRKIIKSQASREERRKIAHDIINNDTTEEQLENQLKQFHKKYLEIAG